MREAEDVRRFLHFLFIRFLPLVPSIRVSSSSSFVRRGGGGGVGVRVLRQPVRWIEGGHVGGRGGHVGGRGGGFNLEILEPWPPEAINLQHKKKEKNQKLFFFSCFFPRL